MFMKYGDCGLGGVVKQVEGVADKGEGRLRKQGWGFLGGSRVKNLPASEGDTGLGLISDPDRYHMP